MTIINQNLINDFSHIRTSDFQKILIAVNKFSQQFPNNSAEISFADGKSYANLRSHPASRAFKGDGAPSIYIHESNRQPVFTTQSGNKNFFCSIDTFLKHN